MFYFIKGLPVFRIVTEPCADRFLLLGHLSRLLVHTLTVFGLHRPTSLLLYHRGYLITAKYRRSQVLPMFRYPPLGRCEYKISPCWTQARYSAYPRAESVSDSFSCPARCLFASEPLESFNRTTLVVQVNDSSGSVERLGWFTSKCPLRAVKTRESDSITWSERKWAWNTIRGKDVSPEMPINREMEGKGEGCEG